MEIAGIEPATLCMLSTRATNCAKPPSNCFDGNKWPGCGPRPLQSSPPLYIHWISWNNDVVLSREEKSPSAGTWLPLSTSFDVSAIPIAFSACPTVNGKDDEGDGCRMVTVVWYGTVRYGATRLRERLYPSLLCRHCSVVRK